MIVKEAIQIFQISQKNILGREPKTATVTFLNILKIILLIFI